MCAAWGLVSGLTGVVNNFVGLALCRVFLGFTEAAFFPGAVFLLSMFYEKKKMAFRTAILYSGSQIGVSLAWRRAGSTETEPRLTTERVRWSLRARHSRAR